MAKISFDPNTLKPDERALYNTLLESRKQKGVPFDGPYSALMNHPALCQKIEALGFYLKFNGHLPRNIYQFVVLAVASYTKAEFEWRDHIDHAIEAGVPSVVIQGLKEKGVFVGDFPFPYKAAAMVLNSTLTYKNIPDEAQAEAIKEYGMYGFIEIVVLSGFYQMFAAINQGFDL
jgi:4-carboxymuconolactone decarboxylase